MTWTHFDDFIQREIAKAGGGGGGSTAQAYDGGDYGFYGENITVPATDFTYERIDGIPAENGDEAPEGLVIDPVAGKIIVTRTMLLSFNFYAVAATPPPNGGQLSLSFVVYDENDQLVRNIHGTSDVSSEPSGNYNYPTSENLGYLINFVRANPYAMSAGSYIVAEAGAWSTTGEPAALDEYGIYVRPIMGF